MFNKIIEFLFRFILGSLSIIGGVMVAVMVVCFILDPQGSWEALISYGNK